MKMNFNMYRQFLAAGTGALITMTCGTCFAWVAQILVHLLGPDSEVPMTPDQSSWMIALIDVGGIITPPPTAFIVNKIGRKLCILVTGPIFLFSWFLALYVKRVEALYVSRGLQGFAMGLVYTALPVYMSEISSPEIRGMITNLFPISLYFGLVFEYCIGSFLSYDNLIYVTAIVPALFTISFFFQPESPYYLVMKGKREEAAKALAWLRRKRPEDVEDELEEITKSVEQQMGNKTSWTAILTRPEDRRGVIISQLVGGMTVLSGIYVIWNYATQLFTQTKQTFLSPAMLTIIIGLVMFVSGFFSSAFIDRAGRRPIVIISTLGCALAQLSISIYLFFDTETDIDVSHLSYLPPLGIIIFCMFYSFGLDPVATAFRTELFPMDTRGTSAALCSLNFATGSFVVLKLYQPITDYVGVYFNFFLYSMCCFLGSILMYFLVIETKGKSLAEVQEILSEVCGKDRTKKDKNNRIERDMS